MMTSMEVASSVDVLVVDDEESIREGCRQALSGRGCRAMVARDGLQGINMVKETKPRLVLLDQRMPRLSGMEMLQQLPGIDPAIVPIVITGYGTVDSAVTSMKLGAFDFIAKPFDMNQLLEVVGRGLKEWETKAAEAKKTPAATPAAPATPRNLTEPDVLLEGLEVIEQYRSLGFNDQSLLRQLSSLQAEAEHYVNRIGEIRQEERVIGDLVADLKLADSIIEKHDYKKNALIQILLDVQAAKRWLPRHILLWIGRRLGIPMSR
ncbi:MAG: response regulator, partial [Spirochaetales bacterium]|nr:response regulator [Spirochaetales bacterium]